MSDTSQSVTLGTGECDDAQVMPSEKQSMHNIMSELMPTLLS